VNTRTASAACPVVRTQATASDVFMLGSRGGSPLITRRMHHQAAVQVARSELERVALRRESELEREKADKESRRRARRIAKAQQSAKRAEDEVHQLRKTSRAHRAT